MPIFIPIIVLNILLKEQSTTATAALIGLI